MYCPNCQEQMLMVQYRGTSEDYDGVSEYACDSCQLHIGRWSGKVLDDLELEPRYGIVTERRPDGRDTGGQ